MRARSENPNTAFRRRAFEHGFTLMELMVVVVIVGILASLAIYSVTKYIASAKTAEAREVLTSIKAGQEAYRDETFRYLGVSNSADTFYPSNDLNGRISIQWGASFAGCTNGSVTCDVGFKTLGVEPTAAVRFRYTTVAGTAGSTPSLGTVPAIAGYNLPAAAAAAPWYVAKAVSDLDGDGVTYSAYVTSSFQSEIYEQNGGE